MMDHDLYERATRTAQGLLSAGDGRLVVDGKWGRYTAGVYAASQPQTRNLVDSILKVMGTTAIELATFRRQEKDMGDKLIVPTVSDRWVPEPQARVIVEKAALVGGVDFNVLWSFLQLEAAQKVVNGVRYYDSGAVNSLGYVGWMQFDPKGEAWQVASRNVPGLVPFSQGKTDPYQSALAAAGYIKANTLTIRRLGYKGPITAQIAYLMHNQGATGAFRILTGQVALSGKQSDKAIQVAQQAVAQARA